MSPLAEQGPHGSPGLAIAVAMLVSAASRARATAGFAETSREFVYGPFILRWHHGDICPDAEGKSCFSSDPSDVPPLAEVSVPPDPAARPR